MNDLFLFQEFGDNCNSFTMAYFDRYLADGERVVYRTTQHSMFTFFSILSILISFVGFLNGFENLAVICLGLAAFFAVNFYLLRRWSDFVVTNRRVLGRFRGLDRSMRYEEVSLIELRTVEFKPGLLGRLLGYGTVVATDAHGEQHRFPGVPGESYRQVEERVARIQRILK